LTHEGDGPDRQRNADKGSWTGPLAEQHRRDQGNHNGTHRGGRRDHRHPANGKCPIQETETTANGNTRHRAPREVWHGRRSIREQRKHDGKDDHPGKLRHDDDRHGVGSASREPAQEVGGAVQGGGTKRKERCEQRPLSPHSAWRDLVRPFPGC
jgi:hypothetical protein